MRLKQRIEKLEKEAMRGSGGVVVAEELGEGRYSWDEREFENESSLNEALRVRFGEGGIRIRVILRKFG